MKTYFLLRIGIAALGLTAAIGLPSFGSQILAQGAAVSGAASSWLSGFVESALSLDWAYSVADCEKPSDWR